MKTALSRLRGSCGLTNRSARDAWLEAQLAAIPSGSRLLDAGAGELRNRRFCEHLDYVSQDFAQYDGRGDDQGLQTCHRDYAGLDIVSDITAIPVPDESFDAVLCSEVLEHVPNPDLAIREFARVLRRGGRLLLTAPVGSLTHYAPYYFYSGFSRYYFQRFLVEAGFEIQELSHNGNWFEYVGQELRRLPTVARRYCRLPLKRLAVLSFQACLVPLLWLLQSCSCRDTGASELLSFGIHVRAVKRG